MLIDLVDTMPVARYWFEVMLYHPRLWTSNFCVKIFISLYLLNMMMDRVDTLHVGRYWSEALCCTITTYLGDFEVKVMDRT